MNEIDKRKLNLLVHLARVDGKYDKSERRLLQQFVMEKGLDTKLLNGKGECDPGHNFLTEPDAKIELLYWAIRLIQADQVIHNKELAFGKSLASKLNFKDEIVAYYANTPLGDFGSFQQEVKQIWMTGL
jgi:uncharacterized membrane protein YebE (DUF533 family)